MCGERLGRPRLGRAPCSHVPRVTSCSLPLTLYPGPAHEHFAVLALVRFVESFMNLMRIASFTAVDGWHEFLEYLVHYIPAELVETSVCFVFFLDDGNACSFSRLGLGFAGMVTWLVYRDKADKLHRPMISASSTATWPAASPVPL